MTHTVILAKTSDVCTLYRGERAIVVDGVTWGRTHVQGRGVHGNTTTFSQINGEEIGDITGSGRHRAVEIRSIKRRRWLGSEDKHRPTLDMVLEKAIELVNTGRLRDPAIVKAEVEKRRAVARDRAAENEREKNEEFERRAREALRINDNEQSELVDRVVKAMRWAQQQ